MIICLDQRTGAGCGAQNRDNAQRCNQCSMPLRFALLLRDPDALVGDYRIIRVIGHGAAGAVYEAEDTRTLERVAFKESFDPSSISSFQEEFAMLRQLQHPNLPRYHAMFEADGNGCLVMELVPGQSLQDVLDKQHEPLPENQVLGYALQLCAVLGYLHGQRPPIVHRDIKPANIRLTPEGRIKLVDFGLLKQGSQQTRMTIRGMGTPAYAPIEQYGRAGQHTDPRSDIYSLGATLYHLLTGQEPPTATDRVAMSPDPLLPPQQRNRAISRHVSDATMFALSLAQRDRPVDTAAFKQALVGLGRPILRRPNPPKPPALAKLIRTFQGNNDAIRSVAFSPAGKLIAAATQRTVWVWWADTGNLLHKLREHEDHILSLAFSPDGSLIASAGWDRTVRIWRLNDGRLLGTLEAHNDAIHSIAWHLDGEMLASGGWDETLCFWRMPGGKLIGTLEDRIGRVNDLAWSADGRLIATAGAGHLVQVWRLEDSCLLHQFAGHSDTATSVAWHPDGQMLASGSMDSTTRVWNMADGQLLYTLHGHTKGVTSLAWRPDGQTLATGGWDQTVHVWHGPEYRLAGVIEGHSGCVWSVAWRPDGQRLASGSADWRVHLWLMGAFPGSN
jgi:eukaryotic-like serine/threonine-protein kinase